MKSNEVYDRLRNKVDPEVVKVLVAICEDQAATKKHITGLAHSLSQLIDLVSVHSQMLDTFKEPLMAVKRDLERQGKRNEMVMSEPVMGVDEEIDKS